MWPDIAVVIGLGLMASFLPLQLGVEILLLQSERGFGKAAAFLSGVNSWRLLLVMLWIVIVGKGASTIQRGPGAFIEGIWSTFSSAWSPSPFFRTVFIVLLIVAGAMLLYVAARNLVSGPDPAAGAPRWAAGLDRLPPSRAFLIGFLWLSVGINSYILLLAALHQIVALPATIWFKLGMLFLFLLLGNTVLALPILIYARSPERSQQTLARFQRGFNTVGRWLSVILAGALGAYLMYRGIMALR